MTANMNNFHNCNIVRLGEEHRTHVDGTFYQMPHKFPCVFHDRTGCLCLLQEQYKELVKIGLIRESTGGAVAKVNIKNGISKIPGYQVCAERTSCPRYRARKEQS